MPRTDPFDDATRLSGGIRPSDGARLSDSKYTPDATRLSDATCLSDNEHMPDDTCWSDGTRLSGKVGSLGGVPQFSVMRHSDDARTPATAHPPAGMTPSDVAHRSGNKHRRNEAEASSTMSQQTAGRPGEVQWFRQRFDDLAGNVARVVVGKKHPVRLCVAALLAGGHVLLEGEPGTGKTQLARGLANSVDASFRRIQFTPDLLPSDVIGATVYDQEHQDFRFRKGPVFASIVLADEINRASPKAQSALLEVMEERQITVDGVTHTVPSPFIVIATQNPVDQLGTYRLPEAQMDRFLIRTSLGHPGHAASIGILQQASVPDRAGTVTPVLDRPQMRAMAAIAERLHVDDAILEYVMRLVEAARRDEMVVSGPSMRGALALVRCARVWAAADGRDYVVPDDVAALASAVLAHRVTLTTEAIFAGHTAMKVIEQVLGTVPVPQNGSLKTDGEEP